MATPDDGLGVRVRVTRDLGLFDVTMAAVGAMVGAAIFVLVGATYAAAGPLTLTGVALAGGVAFLAGLAYAELAAGRPGGAGGAYEYVRAALPGPSGFVSGWLSWGGHMAASAMSALGLGIFLVALTSFAPIPVAPVDLQTRLVAFLVLAVSAAFHFARIHVSTRTLGRLTFVKILLILILCGIGVASLLLPDSGRGPVATSEPVGPLAAVLGVGVFFIAFQGFEVITQLSDQAKDPGRTIPRGMALAVIGSLGLYLLFFVAILYNVPSQVLANWPACDACLGATEDVTLLAIDHFIAFPWIRELFLLVGVVTMYAALNATLTSAIKTSLGMARDGLLPRPLARVGAREVPPTAVLVTVVVTGSLLLLGLEAIAVLASLSFLLLFALIHASVVALRRKDLPVSPGFRMPFVPWLPLLAVAMNVAFVVTLVQYPNVGPVRLAPGVAAVYVAALWLALGFIVHWFMGGRHALARRHEGPHPDVSRVLVAGEEALELERYRVFLPLREFHDQALVEFGARVAASRGGEMSLLNVVEVPRNLPPKAIRFRYVDDRIRGLQKLARLAAPLGVDTRAVVKIGSKVYEIILDTVREEAVNLLVMGWRGDRPEGDRRILGSNIDYLIENAPCDVAVLKTKGMERPLARVVILTSSIWSLEGIGDLAIVLAEADRSSIEVLALAADPPEAEALKSAAVSFLEMCQARGLSIEHKVLYTRNWESVALQASNDASLLAVGAATPSAGRKYPLNPVEDRIAKLAKCPVLIFRRAAVATSDRAPSA
ncbi:MAG TPA: amino acid permease [Thermoplasmata archaeon]|nr:amino acid permease [Thermoplasmata archaeon]